MKKKLLGLLCIFVALSALAVLGACSQNPSDDSGTGTSVSTPIESSDEAEPSDSTDSSSKSPDGAIELPTLPL